MENVNDILWFFVVTPLVGAVPGVLVSHLLFWFLWFRKRYVLSAIWQIAAILSGVLLASVIRFGLFFAVGPEVTEPGVSLSKYSFNIFAPAFAAYFSILIFSDKR